MTEKETKNLTSAEKLIIKSLFEIKQQLKQYDSNMRILEKQNIYLKNYIETNLSEDKLDRIACAAIRKTTLTSENHKVFIKSLGDEFEYAWEKFDEVKDLINKSVEKTVSQTTANLYVSRSGGIF